MCLLPKPESSWERIDLELVPPSDLVTMSMKRAMMNTANRNCKLVAHSASKCTGLGKGEVVRIRWRPPAHKARLSGDKPAMFLIA
jgi:hypothetical protein